MVCVVSCFEHEGTNIENHPPVSSMDIVGYSIWKKCPFTADHLRAYRSLDTYNQVINGWVRDVKNTVPNLLKTCKL